jgi:hypothetical protein
VKIICAWCDAEGRPSLIGEKELLDDPDETRATARHMEYPYPDTDERRITLV